MTPLSKTFENGDNGEIYNIDGGEEKTNLEVVKTVCDLLDDKTGQTPGKSRHFIRYVKDRPGHDLRYAINPDKAFEKIGFKTSHTFEQALSATIDWYMENMDWVKSVQTGAYREWIRTHYESLP